MPGEHRGREARDDGRFAGREVGRFALILVQVVQERLRAIVLTEEFPIALADREVGLRGRQRGRPCLPVGWAPPAERPWGDGGSAAQQGRR